MPSRLSYLNTKFADYENIDFTCVLYKDTCIFLQRRNKEDMIFFEVIERGKSTCGQKQT